MLAALAEGTSDITHFSAAADCRSTLDCFSRLGVKVESNGDRVRITGAGLGGLRKPRRALDAGNSGTTMRLLSGILSGQEFRSTIDGDGSLPHLRHEHLGDRPPHRTLSAADVLTHRRLRDIHAVLIDEPLMDPLRGMPLLARRLAITLEPPVDHRPIRPQLRRRATDRRALRRRHRRR